MRSLLLVISAVVILGGLFAGYSALQSLSNRRLNVRTGPDTLPAPPTTGPSTLKPGSGVWVSSYDEGGKLKNRFKSDDYTPQDTGTVKVTNPVAEFYMPNNRMMKLIGTDGDVFMSQSSATGSGQGPTSGLISGSPDRGIIHNVTIELYNMLPDSKPLVPDETITTDNIEFDNATRVISTQHILNKPVAADQVPVHMEAPPEHTRGYNLDGRGLRLRWNDKDGRLDLLEIFHGEQLIVWDASSASKSGLGGSPMSARSAENTGGPPVPRGSNSASQQKSVSFDGPANPSASLAQPLEKSASTTAAAKDLPPVPVPYVATFYDNVRIAQGEESLITADRMDVDFISRQNKESPPTTAPSANATAPPAATAQAVADDAAKHSAPAAADAMTETAPATTSPTTKPTAPPVVIQWTGKLVMLSAQKNRPKVTPGDAIVELNGTPVNVRRTPAGQIEGDRVVAGKLIYHTGDGSVKLVNSQTTPEVIISKLINGKIDPDSTVTTGTLDYVADPAGKKQAILTGPGHAKMPLAANDAKKAAAHELMDTHWQNGAKVYFREKTGDDMLVDHIDLAGNVDVKHPQLAMQSQTLSLYFDAPIVPSSTSQPAGNDIVDSAIPAAATTTTRPAKSQQQLKRVVATKAVHCVLAGQDGKKQTIDSSELEMLTAESSDGKFYARQVNAGGAVHAFDADQDLRADTVALTLKPAEVDEKKRAAQTQPIAIASSATEPVSVASAATQPAKDDSDTAAVELEKMIARDNVLVTNKDGSSAIGSLLIVTTEDHQNHVRLTGSPTAMVMDVKKNTVIGPLITFEQGIAHVIGAGKMHVLQEQQPGSPNSRPMDATWVERADMNGSGNKIDLIGSVVVTTFDTDGTVNVASGDRVHIDLIDKPAATTKPSTQPASKDKAATGGDMQMGVMKDKDARTITLEGNSQVVSTLKGGDGTVVRQFALYAPRIIYQLVDSKELPAKSLFVPSAGKMYVGDHHPPQPRKADDKKNDEGDAGGRGDTAFQWSKQLVYRELQRNAVMTGDVVVVHWPLGKQAEEDKVRINADRVTAWFEPQPRVEKIATATQVAETISATTVPTTLPTTGPARVSDPGQSLSLKHLTADGHVVILKPATGATLYADRVDYDPHTHWMTAHGNKYVPAHYVDPDPHKSLTGAELQGNTETWNIKVTQARTLNPQ